MGQLESILSLSGTAQKVQELRAKFEGKSVLLGVDDMDMFKGISLKFLAMGILLDEHPELRKNVVLVQIVNPARSSGKDIQEVQDEINRVAFEVNSKYSDSYYEPIVFVNGPVSTQENAAYFAISECCVVNAVRDGMNLVPYKYTVCRQGTANLDKALGIEGSETPRQSMIIVSEFIGCLPSLSGAIRVNPWNIDDVSDAMNLAIRMSKNEKHLRHEKHYKYISSHDVAYWARSFDQDLERACRDHYQKRCWGIGVSSGFDSFFTSREGFWLDQQRRVLAATERFRRLPSFSRITGFASVLQDYCATVSVAINGTEYERGSINYDCWSNEENDDDVNLDDIDN